MEPVRDIAARIADRIEARRKRRADCGAAGGTDDDPLFGELATARRSAGFR